MAAYISLEITDESGRTQADRAALLVTDNKHLSVSNIEDLISGLKSGSLVGSIKVNTTQASGTVTAASVAAGDTVTINGVSLTAQDLREITSITCVADSSGSLNNKYFTIQTAGDAISYYVWFNVNSAGTDPAVSGKTAVPVALATDASDSTVATAVAAALDALAGFAASAASEVVTVTNAAIGATTDAANAAGGSSPGFTITATTDGADEPDAGKFSMNTSNTVCAASLADAINNASDALISSQVEATSSAAVVTIKSKIPGVAGNAVTLASSNGTRLAVSAARLTGGAGTSFGFGA